MKVRGVQRREQNRLLGRCRTCSKPNNNGKKHCQACLDREASRRYGIPIAEVVLLRSSPCQACGATTHLRIDHDHATGLVRGVLCNSCNHALGNVADRVDILEALIAYLNHSRTP